jgi:ribonuclease P protein component
MLPKSKRLNLKTSFKKIASGKHIDSPSFKIMYKIEGEEVKVGIALTKSSFAKAHIRNRVRRLTSKAIERSFERLRKGLNLVIIPKPSVENKTIEELYDEFESIKDIH